MIESAFAREPDNAVVVGELAIDEVDRSHPESALRFCVQTLSILGHPDQQLISASGVVIVREENEARAAGLTGDFQKAARTLEDVVANRATGQPTSPFLALFQAHEHDLAAARATLEEPAQGNVFSPLFNAVWGITAQMGIDSEAQNWSGVVARGQDLLLLSRKYPGTRFRSLTLTVPLTAYAQARLGNIASAEAQIASTPGDCYDCLLSRARIAALRGQASRADWWFDRAVTAAPSIPMAYSAWGEALLGRGQPDAAIEKFKLANQKGPHFADPLEMWGEALMAQNRSDLALAKFAEADKYAPNWGRLHLKWDEALIYAGKRDEAKAQFARAAGLDLTSGEKSELKRMSRI
jgi:tetratricopeptide (TPR) repeat protein